MNSWKEHAHLFANGKFKLKAKTPDPNVTIEINSDTLQDVPKFKDPKLIARPIEDMTDEENDALESLKVQRFTENGTVVFTRHFLYMLSIGVYPFDQSHFETGEVIDRSTL